MKIGDISNTDVAIIYMEGIAQERTVAEVKQQLENINTDAILESNHIEELIQDKKSLRHFLLYSIRKDLIRSLGVYWKVK
ncbi:hypothetical protein GCM10020331_103010 [Ectobacillus funiculus]